MSVVCERLEHASRDGALAEAPGLVQQIVAEFANLRLELDGVAVTG